MAVENLKEKLAQIVSNEPSKWIEEARWRRENISWLKQSQAVAIKILSTLRENGLSQKDLAERLNVSPQQVNKWVKGKENFTFETVAKIENALSIELMAIVGSESKKKTTLQLIETPDYNQVKRIQPTMQEIFSECTIIPITQSNYHKAK